VAHVRFQVAIFVICLARVSFDAVFTCAVLEHLAEPVRPCGK